jgi:hypothetical protein
VTPEWTAAAETASCIEDAFCGTMNLDRFDGVRRATRCESTRRQAASTSVLVLVDRPPAQLSGSTDGPIDVAHRRRPTDAPAAVTT